MCVRLCLVAALATGTCACSARQPWTLAVPTADLRPASTIDAIYDYRTAASTVAWSIGKELGLPPFPVTFHFFPGREAFERALLEVGYEPALAERTASAMTAVGGHRGVLLNADRIDSLEWIGRVSMMAHELGHSLQYELGGGTRGTSDQWLREGFAEWLAMRVLERLDAVTMADIRRLRLRELHAAGRSRAPALAELVTFPQWVAATPRGDNVNYALAFIATDFLLERHGVSASVEYFKRFAVSQDRAANFRAAFGEELQAFEAALDARLWRR